VSNNRLPVSSSGQSQTVRQDNPAHVEHVEAEHAVERRISKREAGDVFVADALAIAGAEGNWLPRNSLPTARGNVRRIWRNKTLCCSVQ